MMERRTVGLLVDSVAGCAPSLAAEEVILTASARHLRGEGRCEEATVQFRNLCLEYNDVGFTTRVLASSSVTAPSNHCTEICFATANSRGSRYSVDEFGAADCRLGVQGPNLPTAY